MVYLETIRDIGGQDYTNVPLIVGHELGHAGGAFSGEEEDHAEGGAMQLGGATIYMNRFEDVTILRLRSAEKW